MYANTTRAAQTELDQNIHSPSNHSVKLLLWNWQLSMKLPAVLDSSTPVQPCVRLRGANRQIWFVRGGNSGAPTWICDACRSMVMMWSAPATDNMLATSLADMGARLWGSIETVVGGKYTRVNTLKGLFSLLYGDHTVCIITLCWLAAPLNICADVKQLFLFTHFIYKNETKAIKAPAT